MMGSLAADPTADLCRIPLSYDSSDSQTSALRIILTLFPEWEQAEGKIEFVRFKDGITNTVRELEIAEPSKS